MTAAEKRRWTKALASSVCTHMAQANLRRVDLLERGFNGSTYDRMMRGDFLPGLPSLVDLASAIGIPVSSIILLAEARRMALQTDYTDVECGTFFHHGCTKV